MHIAEVVTIAKSLPLLRLNTYKSLILSYSADYRRIFSKKPPEALRNASGSPSLKGFSDIWASAENISHWDIGLAGGVLIAKPGNRAMIYAATTLDNGRR